MPMSVAASAPFESAVTVPEDAKYPIPIPATTLTASAMFSAAEERDNEAFAWAARPTSDVESRRTAGAAARTNFDPP